MINSFLNLSIIDAILPIITIFFILNSKINNIQQYIQHSTSIIHRKIDNLKLLLLLLLLNKLISITEKYFLIEKNS
ncbi:Uncharacterised protein [Salmonella enterica subsp. enterica]|uniref:Uncharacterized protein n=1 Tax=Salmonella enterica I TaxID=59201 RepID=A0A379WQX9_SALET|nr:hypothetical protein [Salmonella enterica]SUH36517.1 Uncharacterised protein [Salmonella enterica subsp. enterica]